MASSLLVGALRAPSRPPPYSLFCQFRTFSSHQSSLPFFSLPRHSHLPSHPILLNLGQSHCQTRLLSLSSLFQAKPKVTPLPTPSTVASIALLENEANADPRDVQKQIRLFEALLGTGMKQGYELVVTRWERMCEFDSQSPLLASDRAFQLYLHSLLQLGLQSSIDPAVRRRDTLLTAASATTTSTATTSTPSSLTEPVSESTSPTLESAASLTGMTAPGRTKSQEIAHSVLSGQSPLTPSFASSVPLGGLASAAAATTQNLGSGSASGSNDLTAKLALMNSGAGGPGNPISVVVHEPKGSWVPRLVRFVVLTGLSAFFILVVLSVFLENSGLLKAGPRQAEFQPQQGKTVKFTDVHGVDEAKEDLIDVVEFLKDPSAFASLGGKLPKGVLLTGQPGTGKTMLARAVAGEAGVPFLFASGSEFDEMFVGVGAKRVRELFAAARRKAPSIIFIDELDAIGGKRSSRDQHYMKQTLNQLLVEMDGFEQGEGVVVIAATNFLESLDPALVRPGRFDRIVAVPLPDVRGRVQILQHHMQNIVVGPEVDLTILARGTPGFSGADIQNMVNQAAIQASKEHAREVALKHLEWAKDRIIMGAERKTAYIDERVKKLTAYHEGGHALVALYTDGAMPLHKVTCVPRGHALGVTSQLPQDDRHSISLKEYLADIDVCMGGRVAEELIFGPQNVTSGASSDLKKATWTATTMVKKFGYSEKIGPVYYSDREETISPQKKEEIEAEVRKLLKAGESRVVELLRNKENELHLLANALIEHETLDLEEVKKVIQGEKIRNIEEALHEDLERITETHTPTPAAIS